MNRNLKLGTVIDYLDWVDSGRIKWGRFSDQDTRLLAYVDECNVIFIGRVENSKLINPFQSSFATSQSDLTSILLTNNEFISGSSKGLLTHWDICTQSIQSNIKGHQSTITSLATYNEMLISGSMDSQVKLWDCRMCNGFTIRGHTLAVSALAISPDGKLLASGSNDGTVKIWDIGTQRLMATFSENDSPIMCLQFNPVDKAIASGSDDGRIKYWDLDKFNRITSTIPDKHAISQIKFCNNGRQLLSAQNFTLRAWDLERDGLLLDEIETQWKSVLDLQVSDDQEVFALSTQNKNGISLFGTKLGQVNLQKQRIHSEKILVPEIQDQFLQRNSVNILKPRNTNLIEEQPISYHNFWPTSQVPQMIAYESVIQEEEVKQQMSLITSQDEVNLSSFVIDDQSQIKFIQIDKINEIVKDHCKVMQILKQRMNYMKPILHWWTNNNVKSAVNAINQLTEPSILFDALSMCVASPKFKQIPIEQIPQLLEKARILIESRYLSHIRGGLMFTYKTLNVFRDDIQTIKGFNQMSKIDLSREERIAKYDKIIEQLKSIGQMPKLMKLIERNKEDASELAKKFQYELLGMLKRISQQQ